MRLFGIGIAFFCLVFTCCQAKAQTPASGNSFWLGFMSNATDGPDDELVITISSHFATSGNVEIPGQSWSQNFYVDAESSVTIALPDNLAEVTTDQFVENRAIHIESDQPVTVQALNYAQSSADATRILPETLLGTKYIAGSYQGLADNGSELLIVATQDGTEMQIIPSTATSAGNSAGVPFMLQLDRGECYRIEASGTNDLTGTQIIATAASGKCRPFAVFGGAGCANVPANCFLACDHLFEQLYDLEKWGNQYVVSPFAFDISSDYSSIPDPRYSFRVLAAQNGTNVSIDNTNAVTLQAGEFIEYNGETVAHCINANQPISVIQYMQGISCGGNGDPAMVVVDPVNHQTSFAIIDIPASPIINTHFVNLLVTPEALGNCRIDGVVIPAAQFSPAGSCGEYLICSRELVPGSHTVECPSGFSGLLYGIADEGTITTSYLTAIPVDVFEPPIQWQQTICSSADVQLNVPPNHSSPNWYYAMHDNEILSSANSFTIPAPIQNAAYELHAMDDLSGCVDTFYYSVESPDPIPITITQDQFSVCSFETVTLSAVTSQPYAVFSYVWSPEAPMVNNDPSRIEVQAEENIDYSVVLTTPSGCGQSSASTTVVITQGDVARFEVLNDDYQICAGESVDLGVEVERVIWRDNFDPAISWGDWEAINGGDESNVCGTVSGNGLYFNGMSPREAITQPLDLTGGGTVYFSLKIANGSAPCDDAEPGDNVVLSYSVNGGAWVAIQTFYESAYPDFISVTVPLPAAALNPNTRLRWRQSGSYTTNQDNWVLENAYVGQLATADFNCAWTPQTSLSSPFGTDVTASPAVSTLYHVTTIDPSTGCDYVDSVWVEVGQPFELIMPDDIVICYPQDVLLTATTSQSGNFEFAWSPNAQMQGAFTFNPTAFVQQTQVYQVNATSEYGCTTDGEILVTLGSLFELSLLASDDSLCEGEFATITATLSGQADGVTFQWSGDPQLLGEVTNVVTVSPGQDATLVCQAVQEASGCQAEQELTIDVTPEFSVVTSTAAIQTCAATGLPVGAEATLNESVQWTWSPAGWVVNPASQNTQLASEDSGVLTVTATSEAGCQSSASISLDVLPLVTDLGADVGLCIGESYMLSVDWPSDYQLQWSTGSTASSIDVTSSGTYSVLVLAPDGCTAEDEVVVEFFDYPELELGNDTSVCQGEEVRLQAGSPGLNYLWNTGQLSREIYVSEPGVYSVEITNGYCFSYDTVEVSFNPLPVQPFLPEYEFCFEASGEVFFLDADNAGSSYVWSNDSLSRVLIIREPGIYSVLISTPYGCLAEFETEVKQECIEALFVPNSFTPDGDGINDSWFVYGVNIVNYHLQLYNRMGEMFYESFDLSKPWMGQRRDGDQYVDSEAYPYIIRYQVVGENGVLSTEKTIKGFVTLIR
jgi:gliding motility-associated-like protein